ncbi:hypothetical protein KCP75_03990 [Salmonella enterica subsp. enterica]|nr:hypothetical protein KCP75_03990 [Salmonella enterica subsp. enterica]
MQENSCDAGQHDTALMSFITVWGFGNVVNNHGQSRTSGCLLLKCLFLRSIYSLCLIVGNWAQPSKRKSGRQYRLSIRWGAVGLAYLCGMDLISRAYSPPRKSRRRYHCIGMGF